LLTDDAIGCFVRVSIGCFVRVSIGCFVRVSIGCLCGAFFGVRIRSFRGFSRARVSTESFLHPKTVAIAIPKEPARKILIKDRLEDN
jgi:hypothetical protein